MAFAFVGCLINILLAIGNFICFTPLNILVGILNTWVAWISWKLRYELSKEKQND